MSVCTFLRRSGSTARRSDALGDQETLEVAEHDPTRVIPVRGIYRRAAQRGEVLDDSTAAIVLPSVRSRRDRLAEATEAPLLFDAVTDTCGFCILFVRVAQIVAQSRVQAHG